MLCDCFLVCHFPLAPLLSLSLSLSTTSPPLHLVQLRFLCLSLASNRFLCRSLLYSLPRTGGPDLRNNMASGACMTLTLSLWSSLTSYLTIILSWAALEARIWGSAAGFLVSCGIALPVLPRSLQAAGRLHQSPCPFPIPPDTQQLILPRLRHLSSRLSGLVSPCAALIICNPTVLARGLVQHHLRFLAFSATSFPRSEAMGYLAHPLERLRSAWLQSSGYLGSA